MSIGSDLDRLVGAGDWQGLRRLLAGMDDESRAAARSWYRRGGRKLARGMASWSEGCAAGRACSLLLALTLADSPGEASTWCEWGRQFPRAESLEWTPAIVELLAARGASWCEQFATAAAQAPLTGEGTERVATEIAELVLPLVGHFDLPPPGGENLSRGWVQMVGDCHTRSISPASEWRPRRPIAVDDAGHAAIAVGLDGSLTLRALFEATPALQVLLTSALTAPGCCARLAAIKGPAWDLAAEVRNQVQAGRLQREELLAAALGLFTRNDSPSAQRVAVRVLAGLDPTADDVRMHLPLLLHVLPTAHGSVTAVLLPLLLGAELVAEDLLDAGTVILARTEKAQKVALVRHLSTVQDPQLKDAVDSLLTLAAASDDQAMATKAVTLLAARTGGEVQAPAQVQPSASLPWELPVTPYVASPFQPWEPSPAGLAACLSSSQSWRTITTEAGWLDLLVRFAFRDRDGLRDALASLPAVDQWTSGGRVHFLAKGWAATGDSVPSYEHTATSTVFTANAPPVVTTYTATHLPAGYARLADALTSETLVRLGAIRELLSTPSRTDGTLSFDDLIHRLRAASSTGYGRWDVVQALLRLEVTDPSRLAELDGAHLDGTRVDGAAQAVRAWVRGGGLPHRTVSITGGALVAPSVKLPAGQFDPGGPILAILTSAIGTGQPTRLGWDTAAFSDYLGVIPRWAESLVTDVECRGNPNGSEHTDWLGVLVHSAGPLGPAVHHHLARLLAHPRQDCRLVAAEQVLVVMGQGRLDPVLLRERSLDLQAHGLLSLARVASAWEQVILGGGLTLLWPTVHAVLEQTASAVRKPAGLADLLRMTRAYAPVVALQGKQAVPPAVRALATSRGTSKAHLEARALVAAVDDGRGANR